MNLKNLLLKRVYKTSKDGKGKNLNLKVSIFSHRTKSEYTLFFLSLYRLSEGMLSSRLQYLIQI